VSALSRPAPAVPASRSFAEKVSLGREVLAAYARTRLALRRGDFRSAVAELRAVATVTPELGDPVVEGRRLGRTVVRTLRLLPTDSRCLMRSLVLTRMLSRRGIESSLVIGVRPGERFAAHAWVEHDDAPLLDPGGPELGRLVVV
jgi:transglutaminase superfamily protein